jgi:hypothetical protein
MTRPGTADCRSFSFRIAFSEIISALSAVTEIGTLDNASSRRRAVTTISVPLPDAARLAAGILGQAIDGIADAISPAMKTRLLMPRIDLFS